MAADVVVSAGHTAMSPADFTAARSAGLSYVTHLYNAMAPFGHRSPGPIGAVLADPSVTVGVICDGIHVDPTAVEMAWRSLGPHRLSLVSDASPALGAPFGRFNIGGFEIVHDETGVRTVDGVLAGSALELDRAVRNLMAYTGCSLADALRHGDEHAGRPARSRRSGPHPGRSQGRPDDRRSGRAPAPDHRRWRDRVGSSLI